MRSGDRSGPARGKEREECGVGVRGRGPHDIAPRRTGISGDRFLEFMSNEASYRAALDHVERKGLPRGRSEFHALQWYHYGQLQLGNEEMGQWALDEAFRTLERFPGKRVRRGAMRMLARHTLETERWPEFDHGILTDADRRHAALQLAAGLSAAHTGKLEAAVQFSKALERTPNRTRSVRGLERARRHASNVGLLMK